MDSKVKAITDLALALGLQGAEIAKAFIDKDTADNIDKGEKAAKALLPTIEGIENILVAQPAENPIQTDREKQTTNDRLASLEGRVDALEANMKVHNDIHNL